MHESPSPLADPRLTFLDRLDAIIWIADIDDWRFVWGNRAAIAFWSEGSLESFVSRRQTVSDTMRAVHLHIRERLCDEHALAGSGALGAGAPPAPSPCVRMEHTVYPSGREAVRLRMSITRYDLPNGRIGLMVEAVPVSALDPDVVRGYEAVRYAPLIVTTHTLDGATLSANALARLTFGDRFSFAELFEDRAEAERVLGRLREGRSFSEDACLRSLAGPRWFAVEARPIPDPVSGVDAFLVSAHDVTARRDAEQAKDELVSVVSHELRTPLTSIRGALDLLASGLFAADRVTEDEMVHIARENTGRLVRLVDDLLDVQKLSARALVLSRAPTDLGLLAQRTIDLHRPDAQLAGVSFSLAPGASPTVDVDAPRIQQVLSNLLSNAVKHSAPGANVAVDIEPRGECVRVSVTDEGLGVPEPFRKSLFTPFAQADRSDTRRLGGTGLGLYIAKTLVEEHGGTLAYDEDLPRGARFYFDLPAAEK